MSTVICQYNMWINQSHLSWSFSDLPGGKWCLQQHGTLHRSGKGHMWQPNGIRFCKFLARGGYLFFNCYFKLGKKMFDFLMVGRAVASMYSWGGVGKKFPNDEKNFRIFHGIRSHEGICYPENIFRRPPPPPRRQKNFGQCTILGVQKFFGHTKIFRDIIQIFQISQNNTISHKIDIICPNFSLL